MSGNGMRDDDEGAVKVRPVPARSAVVVHWRRTDFVIGADGTFTLPPELGHALVDAAGWEVEPEGGGG
jgi:hypothetical protein